ncbi:exopolysaccharide biosynthesis protein [bacterium]|nr:exopolysaccharide biosynthesis protein [bacterium]
MRVEGLAADLRALLENKTSDVITLGTIIQSLGTRGFGVLLFILSLPSALPVPAPGYSTPFGLLISGLAIQMMIGRQTPVLPQWALKRSISYDAAQKIFGAGIKFLHKTEALVRPRMSWMGSRFGKAAISILVLAMAVLMILPIPLTNTIPAAVIFMIGIGLTERDGLIIILSAIGGWIAVALYAAVIYLVYVLGTTSFDQIKDVITFWN